MKNYFKYKNWYSLSRYKLIKKYKQDYKFFASLIASTSPRFSIKRNINTARWIYKDFKLYDKYLIWQFENQKEFVLKKYKILNAHYNNILKCLKHDFKKPLKLNGNKVNSFYNNLIGNYEYVTIDIWMLRYFEHKKAWVNLTEYKDYSNIIKELAYKEGLKPCEMQAIIWTKIRLEHGFKPLNFAKFI